MMRRGVIASGGGEVACLFTVEGLNAPTSRPLFVESLRQEVGAVYPVVAPEYPVWFAATPEELHYSTNEHGWDGWRVVQFSIAQVDSGSVRFGLSSADYGSSIDAIYDSASDSWVGMVNGTGHSSSTYDWSEVVTFRVHGGTGDAIVMVGDDVLAEMSGMFSGTPFGAVISWSGENSVAGDAFVGTIHSSKHAILLDNLAAGDADWCGNLLEIIHEEDVAPGTVTAFSHVALLELRSGAEVTDPGTQQETASGSFDAVANLDLIERSVVTELVDPGTQQETAAGAFDAVANLSFIELRQVTQ